MKFKMNIQQAKEGFAEKDWHLITDGVVFSTEELNSFAGITAVDGTELLIDDSFNGDYGVVNDDGSTKIMKW